MKKNVIWLMLILAFVIGCASAPKPAYSLIFDNSIMTNAVSLSSWMSYTAVIQSDMKKFYNENPDGEYVIPFEIELQARESLIKMYVNLMENSQLKGKSPDSYIEDLKTIQNENRLKEYVFFSFNSGSWENTLNLNEKEYMDWKNSHLPNHEPITLAKVEKLD